MFRTVSVLCWRVSFLLLLMLSTGTAEELGKAQTETPGVKQQTGITISRETTFLTKPLTEDGYVDYRTALNQQLGKGVNSENNAAVPLLRVFGFEEGSKFFYRSRYCELLQIPVPDKNKPLLVNLYRFSETIGANQETFLRIDSDYEQARKRPWSAKEFPEIARWVELNKDALELITTASKRQYLFHPIVYDSDDPDDYFADQLYVWMQPEVGNNRECGRLLVVRALQRVQAGKIDGAIADLLTAHRMCRLIGQGPTLIHLALAIHLETLTFNADHLLAHSGKATAEQLMTYRKSLQKLSPPPDTAEKIQFGERFITLDAVSFIDRQSSTLIHDLTSLEGIGEIRSILNRTKEELRNAALDLNLMLKTTNEWYDNFHQALSLETHSQRQEAIEQLQRNYKVELAQAEIPDSFIGKIRWVGSYRSTLSKLSVLNRVAAMVSNVQHFQGSENRLHGRLALTEISLALGAYHQDNKTYPNNLTALTPKYIEKLPVDPYNEKPLHYTKLKNGFLLYSVGEDRQDNKGRLHHRDNPSDDISLRVPILETR